MPDGRQDCDTGSEAPKIEMMKSSQNGRSGEIRSRAAQISHRPERLGVHQQQITHMTYLWTDFVDPY